VAGGSEVTVVWARAPLAESAHAESSAAAKGTAKRHNDIMIWVASRLQSSPVLAAPPDANFGIQGTLENPDFARSLI
jgi:hypothetical protein